MHRRSPLGHIIQVLLLVSLFAGCGENLDPTDPEGAYNLYTKALWSGDASGIWDRSASTTHDYFQEQFDVLVEMDATIGKYLPPTDHKIAREQAGSILTSEVKDGRGLFLKVFDPKQLKLEEKHKVGVTVDVLSISEDEKHAELVTLGGDKYLLAKGEKNDEWFVMFVRSSAAVEGRMKWLSDNQSALQQTVEDLIQEERKQREDVIAELMKLQKAPAPAEEGAAAEAPAEEAAAAEEAPKEDGSDGGQKENP